jgi:hypothetical protein
MSNYISDGNKKLSKKQKLIINSGTKNQILRRKGIGGDPKLDVYPDIVKKQGEVHYEGENGQRISFERDSVRGDKGYSNASAIRLVAGHFGAGLPLYEESDDKVLMANPSFNLDSAYIYISQLSDPDENLKLKDGSIGSAKGKSAIIVKADAVRILSDGGLKLVTQRLAIDSQRQGTVKLKGIDMIAGNDDTALQPITKADNMSKALAELYDFLARFVDTLSEALHWQHKANMEIANHQHITTAPNAPTLPVNSSMKLTVNAAALQFEQINTSKLALMRDELLELENRFTKKIGDDYIGSLYNNTN